MPNSKKDKYRWEVAGLLTKVKNSREMDLLLKDLLSTSEYADIGTRWQLIKMLNNGYSHREVRDKLGVGVATVARGAQMLRNKKGGFVKMLKKYGK